MVRDMMSQEGAACLIISANQVVTPYPVYPLGAAYIVGALVEEGHKAYHFDMLADGGFKGLEEFLIGKRYDLVGVSIRNLDSVDSADHRGYLDDIIKTVECVRENLDTVVVLGGPAFSIMPADLMDLLQADFGIAGEGEGLLPWLASELLAGRYPEKKIFFSSPENGGWRPSELSISTAQYYTDHGGMLNVQTKRGCPYGCSYCSYPTIEGKRIRYRDPGEVAEEVLHLQKHSGARYIFFTDSFFNDPDGKFLEVAEALIRKENSLPWCAFFRPHKIATDELRLLKRAGLAAMELGTDAATDITLDGLHKNFGFEDVLQVHERITEEKIPCAHFIMFGGPDENEITLRQGLQNIEKLDDCVVFGFIGIRILPDTGIFERAVADGIIDADDSLLAPRFYYSPEISRDKIEQAIKQSFGDRMDRIYPCHEFDERVVTLHKMGYVGPLWDFILRKGRR